MGNESLPGSCPLTVVRVVQLLQPSLTNPKPRIESEIAARKKLMQKLDIRYRSPLLHTLGPRECVSPYDQFATYVAFNGIVQPVPLLPCNHRMLAVMAAKRSG